MVDNGLIIACRMADADFKARVSIGAQMLGNGFDAVVAAGAALAADAQLTYGHIHIILDNSDIIRVDVIEVGVGTYGNAAEIHVGGRLDDDNFFGSAVFCHIGTAVLLTEAYTKTACQLVNYHKADVVTGIFVFAADIAKADN